MTWIFGIKGIQERHSLKIPYAMAQSRISPCDCDRIHYLFDRLRGLERGNCQCVMDVHPPHFDLDGHIIGMTEKDEACSQGLP
ncbi:hypothetical protein M2D63_014565 [Pseudomonas sp. BJa5]|uniref:hypothetical protein n=1 Tax=Pseudomonas sp. BJa5 TaxID=2936270 RepID=UPI002559551D|nr:hypothetical protein [Pseudomonas sp. BGr12]MDL2422342.1 hypothetical protein [Pseudomonas sp. BGr12]